MTLFYRRNIRHLPKYNSLVFALDCDFIFLLWNTNFYCARFTYTIQVSCIFYVPMFVFCENEANWDRLVNDQTL